MDFGRGFLLAASAELGDPHFAKTVSLICSHGDEGSYGLILNRPLGRTLGDLIEGLESPAQEVAVFEGGPVDRSVVQLLHEPALGAEPIVAGVHLGARPDDVQGLGEHGDAKRVRAFLGYAGWGAGQLAHEIAEGSWFVARARTEHVFDVPSEELWPLVLRDLGGRYAWDGLSDGDPSRN